MSSRAKPCWRSENSIPLSEVFKPDCCSALERRRVALEEVERVGAVHHQAGADITVAIDVELDVDAAELRRIESNLEMLVAGVGLRRDLDGEAGQRHGGGLRWGLRLRRDICGRCRRVGGRCELKILHRVGAGLDRTRRRHPVARVRSLPASSGDRIPLDGIRAALSPLLLA